MRFVWGLIGMAIGTLFLWKTYQLVSIFGKIDWAERHLASGLGGTYFLYKIIGIVIIVISMMYAFGLIDVVLSPFSGIFGGLDASK